MLTEDELREAVLLVFANKQVCLPLTSPHPLTLSQDLPNALPPSEITEKLGLSALKSRTWYIQVQPIPWSHRAPHL